MSDNLIDVIFAIFDDDNDGTLSWKELTRVMRADKGFGLAQVRRK